MLFFVQNDMLANIFVNTYTFSLLTYFRAADIKISFLHSFVDFHRKKVMFLPLSVCMSRLVTRYPHAVASNKPRDAPVN